jgi:hypothetical protein
MKKLLLLAYIIVYANTYVSQTYTPIITATTGFNLDAVAETTTALLTTSGPIDGSNFVLYSASYGALFSPAGTGLPNSGTIVNGTRTYQMKPYTQNNLMYLLANQVDSIMFVTPGFYSAISTLNFGTEGSPSMSITIRFTDNSTQTFVNQIVPDWFSGTGAIITGFDRVSRTGTTPSYAPSTDPRMHASHFHVACGNRTKQIKTVIIKNSGTTGRLCVAALSGAALPVYSASITNIPCAATTSSATIVTTGGLPPFTYSWGTSPVQTAVTATGLAVGNYSYTVTDAIGCVFTSTASMPPTTGSQLPPVMLPFQNPSCSGQSVTFNATGAASYTWTGGLTNGVAFTPTTSTIPIVTDYTVTGANSCNTSTNSTIVSLTVNPNPVITSSSSSPTLCTGGSVTLTAAGAVSYTWSNGINNGAGFTPVATGTYTVIGTSSLNCTTNAAISVTVLNTPTAAPVAQPSYVCVGGSTTLTATGASNYTWLPGNSNSSTISVSPTSTSIYTVTKANGLCTDTKTISITVNQLPTVTASANPSLLCAGSVSTLTAISAPGSTFTWQPINATGSVVMVSPITPTTICLVAAFDGSCVGAASLILTTIPVPTISVVASSTNICAGGSVTLSATGGTAYAWIPGGATTPSIVVSPNAPIQYSVTGANAQGCFAGTAKVIIVVPSPTISLLASNPLICNGESCTLTLTGGVTYSWSTGANSPSIVVNPTLSSVYTATVANQASCNASSSVAVDVFSPTTSITGNSVVCNGQSAILSAPLGAASYSWSNGSSSTSNTVTPLSNTIYSLTTTTPSANVLCSASASFQVNVIPNPTVTVISSKAIACKNELIVLTASGGTVYNWTNNTATTPTISTTSTLITTLIYSVTGTAANGCSSTATISVKVDACNGLREESDLDNLMVYPNPSNGDFTIRFSKEINLNIYSTLGQFIQTIELTNENYYQLNVSGLANGIYFIRGESNGQNFNGKIIVRN